MYIYCVQAWMRIKIANVSYNMLRLWLCYSKKEEGQQLEV